MQLYIVYIALTTSKVLIEYKINDTKEKIKNPSKVS
jgi:hypothetical protein